MRGEGGTSNDSSSKPFTPVPPDGPSVADMRRADRQKIQDAEREVTLYNHKIELLNQMIDVFSTSDINSLRWKENQKQWDRLLDSFGICRHCEMNRDAQAELFRQDVRKKMMEADRKAGAAEKRLGINNETPLSTRNFPKISGRMIDLCIISPKYPASTGQQCSRDAQRIVADEYCKRNNKFASTIWRTAAEYGSSYGHPALRMVHQPSSAGILSEWAQTENSGAVFANIKCRSLGGGVTITRPELRPFPFR